MNKKQPSYVKNIIIYVLIILFFISIVFVYYRMLYQETRENIISTGRNDAVVSANRINMYLSSSVDILKLSGYTVDNMILEDRSKEDILGYLTDETVAVRNSLIADTTGVYGYIKGEYMDGSGWVPEDGYDPTIRPWYTEARNGNGELVMVDPYMDLDTGTVMIAISRTLCDGESVVGIDLSLHEFQMLIEEHLSEKRFFEELIINGNGNIIAHSDNSLVGEAYSGDTNALDKLIYDNIQISQDNFFFIEYDHKDYMVYIMPLSYDWSYITVIDATDDYNRLRIPLVITVVTAVIMVALLSFFIIKSDKKSREAHELALQSERMMAANEAKTSFLSNMSHEIRTPINAIMGMNEMILREADKDTIMEYSENIRNSGGLLLGLVDDIMDFSKLEAGKLEVIRAEYDLSLTICDLVNMISDRVREKGLTLNLDFDNNMPKHLKGDEQRIRQVIMNLLTNAVKYTEKGSITFAIGFEQADAEQNSIILKVSVKDSGIGIKEEDLEKLFWRFERIEEKRNRNIQGTGLGLNITQGLLEMMDSTLMVESTYGEGSVFGFRLKQEVIGEEKLGDYETFSRELKYDRNKHKEALAHHREKLTAPTARILAVDDNPMNLVVLNNLLGYTLITVDTADDGHQAVELAGKQPYDLILMDHMMPGMDGIEALHEIRKAKSSPNAQTPVICITANAISGARETYISEGFDDYMSKPVNPQRLEEVLLHYLPESKVEMAAEDKENISGSTLADEETVNKDSGENAISLLDGSLIDTSEGLTNCGSYDSYLALVKMFSDSMEKSIEELNRLYQDWDVKNYTIKIHALKSSARLIGAMNLGELAQSLENAGKSADEEYIRINHSFFIGGYREVGALITDVQKQINGSAAQEEEAVDKPEIDADALAQYYSEISEAADEIDSDRIHDILVTLDRYSMAEADRELIAAIENAADGFEYDEIIEMLKDKV
ncbi:MAG: response regulator [Lachnospiraceae bacterium]|nr:response regulator [Lachnospiraceae bacterium]